MKYSNILLNAIEAIVRFLLRIPKNEPIIQDMKTEWEDDTLHVKIPVTHETLPTNSNASQLYLAGKASLGKRLTLNSAVPINLGCAQAVSKLLYDVKFTAVPKRGIDGTAGLLKWCEENPLLFEKLDEPEKGAIIISPTGQGSGVARGHVGILGELGKMFPNDYAIMSNNSSTGKWDTKWSLNRWKDFYGTYGGLPIYYFRLK